MKLAHLTPVMWTAYLLGEHEERLAVNVVVGDLAGDHRVEAGKRGDQVRQPDRAQVAEVLPVQVGQLLRQEVGVLQRKEGK